MDLGSQSTAGTAVVWVGGALGSLEQGGIRINKAARGTREEDKIPVFCFKMFLMGQS